MSKGLQVGVESYLILLVGCEVEQRKRGISQEVLELRDRLTLRLLSADMLYHLVVAKVFIVVTATISIIRRDIGRRSYHLAFLLYSLLLLVLLLNGLDIRYILILLLYLLMHVLLVVLSTATHDLLRDGGSCDKVSLQ